MGLIVPLLGLVAFLINICFCLHNEQLNMAEFKERFDTDFVDPWDESKMQELAALSGNQVAATGDPNTAASKKDPE